MKTPLQQARQSIQWSLGSQIINQAMVVFFNLLLLTWLTPYDFGVFVFPYLIFSFLRSFQDFGFSEAVIIQKEWDVKLYSTIFWAIAAIALTSAFAMLLLSGILSHWTDAEDSRILIQWLSLALVLGIGQAGFDMVFRRFIQFHKLFWIEFAANLISGVVGIIGAWRGLGFYALVFKTMTYVAVLSALSWWLSPAKPRLFFSMQYIKQNFSFASANIGDQLLQFFFRNADAFLLSRFIQPGSLGLYDRAGKLLVFPVQQASAAVSRALLPSFAALDDEERLKETFLSLTSVAALLSLPVLTVIPFVIDDALHLFFAPEWKAAADLFKVFVLMAIAQGIYAIGGPLFYVNSQVKKLLVFTFISRSSAVIALLVALWFKANVVQLAFVFSISAFVFVFPFISMILKMLDVKHASLWKQLRNILLTCLSIAAVNLMLVYLLDSANAGTRLGIVISVDLVVVAVMLYANAKALMAPYFSVQNHQNPS